MEIIRSQRAVRDFYEAAIDADSDTVEALHTPVTQRFLALIDEARDRKLSHALDLGYGMGHYTLALLEAGFRVVSVDQVSPRRLAKHIAARGLPWRNVSIRACLLEDFTFEDDFGVVIAKDVLHYLDRSQIHRILHTLVGNAASRNIHHLEVFTDIRRYTGGTTLVKIDGEADYRAAEFIETIHTIYRQWNLQISRVPHFEPDAKTGIPYFTATKVIVTARR